MYASLHNHTHYSNASCGFPDSIITVKQLVERANALHMTGVAVTEHEILSSSIEMYKLLEDYPDMKLVIGNEIYCMSEAERDAKRDDEGSTPYYHLILLALDITGWRQLCKLSNYAWTQGFYKRGSYRRITTKEYLREVVQADPGHIICSSACMGGEVCSSLKEGDWNKARNVIAEFQGIFGVDNYYLEIQPNNKDTEQWESNRKVIALAKSLKIPLIATTDAHMLSKDEIVAHHAAKNSKFSEDAEGEDFYATAYLMSEDELRSYLRNNLKDEEIDVVFENTVSIVNRVVGYDGILHGQVIPEIPAEYIPEFEIKHTFKKFYNKYKYFKMFSEKEYLLERYAFYQIEAGLINRVYNTEKRQRLEDYIARLDHEMDIINTIDENLGTKIITYYSTYTFMMDEIWKLGSVVAVGRGSACSWLINYIMGANQIDPIDSPMQEMLFPERHLNKLRFELPDCDYDTSPLYRQKIINRFKEIWGDEKFLLVATFGTLGPKAVLKRACKGLDIDDDVAEKMSTLIPTDRGVVRPLSVCLNPGHSQKIQELITEVSKHKGLKEILLRLEGIIVSLGTHAGKNIAGFKGGEPVYAGCLL